MEHLMDRIRGLLIIVVFIGYVYMRGNSEWQWVSDLFAALAIGTVIHRYYQAWKQRK